MAWTEYYCDAAGGGTISNVNAGDGKTRMQTTNGAYTRGAGAGSTDRFTAASGTPFSGAQVNDPVMVCDDGDSVGDYLGIITAINGGGSSIDIHLTKVSGTRPSDAASGKTATIGGVWLGPNGSVGFPMSFINGAPTNGSADPVRVNYKSGTSYIVNAAISNANVGRVQHQGYTTTVGDGGKFTIDWQTTASGGLTISDEGISLQDCIILSSASTGTANGLTLSGSGNFAERVVATGWRGAGILLSGQNTISECEAYGCNTSNTANIGGIHTNSSAGVRMIRCNSHDHTGSNTAGFHISQNNGTCHVQHCVADSNGGPGFRIQAQTNMTRTMVSQCDAYNNGGDGVQWPSSSSNGGILIVENSNLVKNNGYGINFQATTIRTAAIVRNCGFGSGTMANASGQTNGVKGDQPTGSVTYATNTTPWVDPDNGDFRITAASAKNAGRGSFQETAPSYAGTIGYPDIGAAQHQDSGGGSTTNIFSQTKRIIYAPASVRRHRFFIGSGRHATIPIVRKQAPRYWPTVPTIRVRVPVFIPGAARPFPVPRRQRQAAAVIHHPVRQLVPGPAAFIHLPRRPRPYSVGYPVRRGSGSIVNVTQNVTSTTIVSPVRKVR